MLQDTKTQSGETFRQRYCGPPAHTTAQSWQNKLRPRSACSETLGYMGTSTGHRMLVRPRTERVSQLPGVPVKAKQILHTHCTYQQTDETTTA